MNPGDASSTDSGPPPLRILLIEDNPGDARLIEVMLAEAGNDLFLPERCNQLSTGLERLASPGIDMVLLDLSLPDSHGLDTFLRVQRAAPHTPIIVLSGLNDEEISVNAVHEGAQDYLVKGHVQSHLLVRAIRYAVERKQIQDELEQVAEQLREKNAQMEADLNMAREIQQVFLSQQYPSFPRNVSLEDSSFRFLHHYHPAATVSGDFFNIVPISDTIAGVFVCDVVGHGLRAALVTAIMRGLIEELMPVANEPGRFLTEINRSLIAILKRTDEPLLATAAYLVLDAANGEVRFSIAGHPSPIHVAPGFAEATLLRDHDAQHGPALGLFEDAEYPNCKAPAAAEGDYFVLYTDGLYEVENPDREEFGPARLFQTIRKFSTLPPSALFKTLLAEVHHHSENEEFSDDVCLVSMELARLQSPPAAGGSS